MLDLLARLLASVAGLVAVVFGLQTAAPEPSRATPPDGLEALELAPGLAATLVAEAPTITNPTNIDVDSRGRIWLLEGFNYRKFKPKPLRAAGDRIVILEDTTGDGVSDKTTVFYQGTDIDAAMGIAVFGNKVYVSAYTKIFVFTDTNGDDKPDKKEVLFTASGPADHDHSTHAFVFGPDGRLYFNGGNETRSIMDSAGNVIVDRAGYRVEAKREPYQEGMAFRLDPDATKFEVLGYNFRNPYELAVDSFGTVWQTDNDDDGNRSMRLNYVMEGGNFGYRDEMTGAGWRVRRTNMEPEIPRQHWHSADPGSVPNVRINGAGSPSGITVYEGTLLPKQYHGTIIHADPGPNEVRAFAIGADGAGYTAERLPIVESSKDKMFRPVDVAVAPDGSLFVADWYDAGVGGHNMSDQSQGRIIRIAPPGTRYTVPKLDLSSPAGAARALRSPNLATRQLAYEKLASYGRRAETPLAAMWREHGAARSRARALAARAHSRPRPALSRRGVARRRPEHPHHRAARHAPHRWRRHRHGRAARARSVARGAPRGGDRAAAQREQARRRALGRPRAAVRRTRSLVPRSARRRRGPAVGSLLRRVARSHRRRVEHAGRPRHRVALTLGARAAAAREARERSGDAGRRPPALLPRARLLPGRGAAEVAARAARPRPPARAPSSRR